MTSAPMSARTRPQVGPMTTWQNSTTRTPSSGSGLDMGSPFTIHRSPFTAVRSVSLDSGGLDDRRPAVHFIAHELRRLRGRVSHRLQAQVREALLCVRRNEGGRDLLVQPLDD